MADFEYYHVESIVASVLAAAISPPATDAGGMLTRYREMLTELRKSGGLGQPDIVAKTG